MIINYTSSFIRQYKKLPQELREIVKKVIDAFQNQNNYYSVRVYKLKGRLDGRFSFAVNPCYRIVFQYLDAKEVALLAVGDNEIYW